VRDIPPCVYGKGILDYLNNATVRVSLNIPLTVQAWDLCNDYIGANYTLNPEGSIDVYTNLQGKYKMLVYSGDTDMAVPTSGTKGWIENLGWTVDKPWKQWMINGQVGGYVDYRQNGTFVFTTIHGAGHMAPQWKPAPTYHAIFNFVNNKKL